MLLVPSDCTGIHFHSPWLISFLRFLQIHCVCFGSDVPNERTINVLLSWVELSLHGCCHCIPECSVIEGSNLAGLYYSSAVTWYLHRHTGRL